jgi:RNA polymerase sigma-70 factor, ECF subfamily
MNDATPEASAAELRFSEACTPAYSSRPSEIEITVVGLFDEFRNPIFRYALSLALPAHDAEEITREVFLSLFQHLKRGKSRPNLRGWIFRVAHNLALKHRHANQISRATTTTDFRAPNATAA